MVSTAPRAARRRQTGFTLVSLMTWAVIISAMALVLMRVFPAITEYRTIQSMVNKVAHEGGGSVPAIRAAFDRMTQIEYGVTSISSKDLDISMDNEVVVIKFAYDKEIELVSPVYLLIKFEGHSR
jgi:hypothetical protein